MSSEAINWCAVVDELTDIVLGLIIMAVRAAIELMP